MDIQAGRSRATASGAEDVEAIDGVAKVIAVIEAFDAQHPRLTVSETGVRSGLTRTSVRRHLTSLCQLGYVETDGKHYWLTPRILRLGQGYLTSSRLPLLLQPFLQRASAATGENFSSGVLLDHEVVYIARSNSPRFVSAGFNPGARVPAHTVSAGVAMLSVLDDASLHAWASSHEFTRFTIHTVTEPQRFIDMVRAARRDGYSVVSQSLDLGLIGVSVPLLDHQGRCHASMGATVQAMAFTDAQSIEPLLAALRDAARQLRPLL